jgi:hypothetical protein
MTQEEKDLLLKDLCARLPYDVMVECSIECGESIDLILSTSHIDELVDNSLIVKPYLRPMSSMTDEEKKEYKKYFNSIEGQLIGVKGRCIWLIDWLNKNMFDYHDLIPMGLALEAPEGMYNF